MPFGLLKTENGMTKVSVIPHDRVEYTLEHKDFPTLTITEPDGWKTDDKEYARVDDYDGIFTKFSNNLTFFGDGKDFLKLIKSIYGPDTDVILRRRERHPQTNRWLLSYLGYLDFTTYIFENNSVQIKFNSSGLEDIIKTRGTEKIEIERLDTMDGDTIPELTTEKVYHEGRRIFLKSDYAVSETNDSVKAAVDSNAGNTRTQTVALPLVIGTNQHQDIAQSPYFNQTGSENTGDIGMMFLLNIDRDRNFNIDLSFASDIFFQQYENVQWCRYQICLTIYENGFDFDLKERRVLYELRSKGRDHSTNLIAGGISVDTLPKDVDFPFPQFTKQVDNSYSTLLELKEGESAAFEVRLRSDMYVNNNAGVRAYTKNLTSSLTIEEDSFKDPSTSKMVLAHELGARITKIITGKDDAFYSEALGRTDIGYAQDGVNTGALNGFSHGHWIRGFDALPDDEDNKYKAFTTTFKDFVNHNKVAWNLGIGIEKVGLKERIRMEPRAFFFNPNVTIHVGYKNDAGVWVYPQVSNLKRSVAKEHIYSSTQMGYEKGWDNEEAMGLDEPNAKTTFTLPITKSGLKNVYTQVSKYITGSYPIEFIRRKNILEYPTEDHTNDSEIFAQDLKRGASGVFEERKWEDDFEVAPTNIFSVDTATNLRLSVVNILLRHTWVLATSMLKKAGRYILYSSSEGNSKMTTQLIDGKAYTENGTGDTSQVIVKEDLEKAKFDEDWLEFEYKVDIEMIQQIEGSTRLYNGKTIPNFYGLVQFRNDEGNLETGFLFNLKPNDKGVWQLLKANR